MDPVRAIFFDPDDAEAVVARLRRDGYAAELARERLAGEDDDEDHPWAVVSDAPELVLEVLCDERDGWLDLDDPPPPTRVHLPPAPVDLPTSPRRIKRPEVPERPEAPEAPEAPEGPGRR